MSDSKVNSKAKDYAYMGYYIDGQALCMHMSKKKVEKYLSITRDLVKEDYFILKVSMDKAYQFNKIYLTTEYDRVYTNIDILIIREMFYNTLDQLADAYNTLRDNRDIFSVLDSSCVDKTIDRLKELVDNKSKDKSVFFDARYDFFNNNPIYKMNIYSYLNIRDSSDELWNKYWQA